MHASQGQSFETSLQNWKRPSQCLDECLAVTAPLPISNFNVDSSIFCIKVPLVRSCPLQLLMSHHMAMYENQVSHVLLMSLQTIQSSIVGAKQSIFATPRSFHHFQLQEGCCFGIQFTFVQGIHQIREASTIAEGGGHPILGVIQITHFDTPGSGTFRTFHHARHTTGLALRGMQHGCNKLVNTTCDLHCALLAKWRSIQLGGGQVGALGVNFLPEIKQTRRKPGWRGYVLFISFSFTWFFTFLLEHS